MLLRILLFSIMLGVPCNGTLSVNRILSTFAKKIYPFKLSRNCQLIANSRLRGSRKTNRQSHKFVINTNIILLSD